MQATRTITGLDFVILPSQDLARAERFYGEILGLRLEARWGTKGIEFELGDDLTLGLADSAAIERAFAPVKTGIVALKVADVDTAVAELKAKGVAFDPEIIDSGVCKMAFFEDPDGNRLMLHHRYAP